MYTWYNIVEGIGNHKFFVIQLNTSLSYPLIDPQIQMAKTEEELPRGVEKLHPDAVETAPIIVKKAVLAFFVYIFFMDVVLCFWPGLYHMYLRYYVSFDPVMPSDAPNDITPVAEVYGVHDYASTRDYYGNEVVIFRNYTDCKSTFDNVVFPRRKDQVDTYTKIEYLDKPGNPYRPGVTKRDFVDRTLAEVLKRKDPNEFASFLRIFSDIDFKDLLKAKPDDDFAFDSSFISFFKKPVVSTGIHAAPVAQTLSLQCYGTKSWLFWKSSDLRKHKIYPVASPQGQVMSGDPESILKIPTKVATIYPGDLMYFPPLYFHAVSTNPGKNVMFAIRKIDRESLVRSTIISPRLTFNWIFRYIHTQFYNKSGKAGFHNNKERFPFKEAIYTEVVEKQFEIFADFDGLDAFDLP